MSPPAVAAPTVMSCAAVRSMRPPAVVVSACTDPAVATIATLPRASVAPAFTWPRSDWSRTSVNAVVVPASTLPPVDTSVTPPSVLSMRVVAMLPVATRLVLSADVIRPTVTSPATARSALPPALASSPRTRISSGLPLPMSPPARIVTPATGAVSATMSRRVSPPSRTLPPAVIRTASAVPLPLEMPVMVASFAVSMRTVPTSLRRVEPSAIVSSPAVRRAFDPLDRTDAVSASASVSAAPSVTGPAACTAPYRRRSTSPVSDSARPAVTSPTFRLRPRGPLRYVSAPEVAVMRPVVPVTPTSSAPVPAAPMLPLRAFSATFSASTFRLSSPTASMIDPCAVSLAS